MTRNEFIHLVCIARATKIGDLDGYGYNAIADEAESLADAVEEVADFDEDQQ